MNSKTLRILLPVLVLAIAAGGFIFNYAAGTICAVGLDQISLLCPLGALASMLAAKLLIPQAAISVVIAIILILIFARAFCGWLCPVPIVEKLQGIFKKAEPKPAVGEDAPLVEEAELASAASCTSACAEATGCNGCKKKRGEALDSRHAVLGGSLLGAAIFGFPVFCLVCPIGLTFATILLLVNLFGHGDVTWSVILAPLLLIAEVVLFKKWCHKLCPLSALMSLVAKGNRTYVPTIDDSKCIETTLGKPCDACGRACPEEINIRHMDVSEAALNECTKCRACLEVCPTNAITMPLIKKETK